MNQPTPAIAAAAALIAVAVLAAPAAPAAAQSGPCANAELRQRQDWTHLADCRAYEQVSPVDKNNGEISYGPSGATASPLMPTMVAPAGDLATYSSFSSFAGNPSGAVFNQYLSSRDGSGWSTEGISPPKRAPWGGLDTRTLYHGFAGDLSRMAVVNWVEPGLFALLRRNPDGSFDRVIEAATPQTSPTFAGASADFSHILATRPEAVNLLYLWADGELELVSEVEGTPVSGGAGAITSGAGGSWGRAISADGSRVFWGAHWLYEDGIQTDIGISQCTTGNVGQPGPGGNCLPAGESAGATATFQTAAADGSVVLFTSSRELTDDANTGTNNQGSDLYALNVESGELTDLTSDDDPNGAEVEGVLGASEDLSHIYFVAQGVLAPGATAGSNNLYARHGGTTRFVGTLSSSTADSAAWGANRTPLLHSTWTQLSADGRSLLFKSSAPTSQVVPGSTYDNAGNDEVYLYDADADEVRCISCNPSGAPATGDAALGQTRSGFIADFATYRNISADGERVVFESPEALLPQDTNGLTDVYMWEAEGTGSCASAAENGGCLSLISTGRDSDSSFYQGMSASGDDVFFITRERLVGQDADALMDLYDARVEGGLASQFPEPPPPPCTGAECRGPAPGPPGAEGIGTEELTDPGPPAANPADCSRLERKVKRLAKKVRRAKRKLRRADSRREVRAARKALRHAKRRLEGARRGLKDCRGGGR